MATNHVVKPLGLEQLIPSSDDYHEFSKLVIESLENGEVYKELAANCYRYASGVYGEKIIARKLGEILIKENCMQEIPA